MRPVVHFSVNSDSAGAGLSGKGRDYGFRFLDFRCRRGEHLIDHRHLGRMNGEAAREAIATGGLRVMSQAVGIPEIDVHGFNRRQLCSGRGIETDRPRKPVGLGQVALRVAVGCRPQFGR